MPCGVSYWDFRLRFERDPALTLGLYLPVWVYTDLLIVVIVGYDLVYLPLYWGLWYWWNIWFMALGMIVRGVLGRFKGRVVGMVRLVCYLPK